LIFIACIYATVGNGYVLSRFFSIAPFSPSSRLENKSMRNLEMVPPGLPRFGVLPTHLIRAIRRIEFVKPTKLFSAAQ
jgi:hypothetical protein